MIQSIAALKSAVVVLSKQQSVSSALLQGSSAAMKNIADLLHDELRKHATLLSEVITPAQRKLVRSFSASPEGFLQSHNPASGEIFGIIKQMLSTFQENLASSQREEHENEKAYADLKSAKEAEIEAGQNQVDTKTTEEADAAEKCANSKEDLTDTQNSLAADRVFLVSVKKQCG